MHQGEALDIEVAKGFGSSDGGKDHADALRALFEPSANTSIRIRPERIAAARIPQEDCSRRELNETVDRLINVGWLDERGASATCNARGVDGDSARRHRPEL